MDLSERHREVLRALASSGGPMPHAAIVAAVQALVPQRHEDSIRNARMALEPWLLRRVGEKRSTAYELTEEGKAAVAVTGDQAQGSPVAATSRSPVVITGDHQLNGGSGCARRVSSKSNNDSIKRTAAAASEQSGSPVITGDHRWRPVVSRLTKLLAKALRENEEKDAVIGELRALLRDVSPEKPAAILATEPRRDAALIVQPAPAEAPSSSPPQRPTPEQIKEAIDFRVDQERPKGFKRSEAAFRKDLTRKFNGDRWHEVFEILDEKREGQRVAQERSRAAKQETERRTEEASLLRPTISDSERRDRIRELDAGLLRLDPEARADIGERSEMLAREAGVTPNSFKWTNKVRDFAREIFEKECLEGAKA